MQKKLAKTLMEQAGLDAHTGSCGMVEFDKVQALLPDYQIKIFDSDNFKEILYKGKEFKYTKTYNLFCKLCLCKYYHLRSRCQKKTSFALAQQPFLRHNSNPWLHGCTLLV